MRTRRGTVYADVVVRATEGYTPRLKGQRRAIAPVYSLIIATEPLPDAMWDEIGLRERETFSDYRHLIIYGQRTADGRMVFGGRGAPYHFGSRIRPDFDRNARVFAALERTLHELFPVLRGTGITHRWGGPLGIARDWHASVGLDRTTGLAWAGGYVGDGVSTTNLAGRTLADLITGARHRADRAAVGRAPLARLGARAAALARRERRAAGDDLGRPSRDAARHALADGVAGQRHIGRDEYRAVDDDEPMTRTEITRLREKGSTDRAALDALLDASILGHFGLVADGHPGRHPDRDRARRRSRARARLDRFTRGCACIAAGAPTCLTVTALDGVVVARSRVRVLAALPQRGAVRDVHPGRRTPSRALDVITERLIPGRAAEIRRPRKAELAATLVLALPITEWSLKISDGWPDDPDDDIAGDAWAGVVPMTRGYAAPRPAPICAAGSRSRRRCGRLGQDAEAGAP